MVSVASQKHGRTFEFASQNIKGAVASMAIAGASRSVFNHSGNWPPALIKSTAITMWQRSKGYENEEKAPAPSENELLEWLAVLNNWRTNSKYYGIKRHLQSAFEAAKQINPQHPDRKKALASALKAFA